MRLILGAVAVSLAMTAGCAKQDEQNTNYEVGEDIAIIDAVFTSWDKRGMPGCSLAVAQDGDLIYTRGYGYANLDYDIAITPKTVFDVASLTKQFTAANITMLALNGKLSLDDGIRTWLPELPEYTGEITLRHMMYHTSGLRDYLNLFPLAGRGDYYPITHVQILELLSRQKALIFSPGDKYEYSNTAYMLLAIVIKRAGGQSIGDMTQTRILDPLGMDGSLMYDNSEEIIKNRATGYNSNEKDNVRIVHNYNFDIAGDGQLYSTMKDLLRWDNYLHGAEKPDIYPMMMTEGRFNNGEAIGYAQGIDLEEYRGLKTVGHSGSSWGFRTHLLRFVEPGLSIAISCNADSANPGAMAKRLADHLLAAKLGPENSDQSINDDKQKVTEPVEPPNLSSEELNSFTGNFFSEELDATYRFFVVDGNLTVRIEQEPPIIVTALDNDQFEIRFYDQGWPGPQNAVLEFNRDGSGLVIGFNLSSGSERNLIFQKNN